MSLISLSSGSFSSKVIPKSRFRSAVHYEKYDYVMIVCKYETDYNDLVRKLGIEGAKVKVAKTRKIKARAIWYDEMKAQLIEKAEVQQ